MESNSTAAERRAQLELSQFILDQYLRLHILLVIGYGIMFFLSVMLLIYMRRNRAIALSGDNNAAQKMILPAFEPLLRFLCFATGFYTLFVSIFMITTEDNFIVSKLQIELYLVFRKIIILLLLIFMYQKSVSLRALTRSVILALFASSYTFILVWGLEQSSWGPKTKSWIETIGKLPYSFFYLWVFIRPPARSSKRALREYCAFSLLYMMITIIHGELTRRNEIKAVFQVSSVTVLWGSVYPLFIWRVLQADTDHWRGLGQRAVQLQQLFKQKQNINGIISSEGYHLLIEMHLKYIIDFAYLEFQDQIGVGSTAVVFKGVLNSKKPVAIKAYTPVDVTEETVSEFSQEAALCAALQHPNIVTFYGMCVCPPTICLVSELCEGSLEEIVESALTDNTSSAAERNTLGIALSFMIDAARAVAYLHSFTPAFVHRDIKPANFLVDSKGLAKLTDFGESRIMALNVDKTPTVNKINPEQQSSISHHPPRPGKSQSSNYMTVRGTVDYMAPELMSGQAGKASYGEAADVYSLAITMWDIMNPGVDRYPKKGNHLKIYEWVLDGQRPVMNDSIPLRLQELIQSAWSPHVAMRPSAQDIVNILEEIQEEAHAVFASKLLRDINTFPTIQVDEKTQLNKICGEDALKLFLEKNYVKNHREGIRLGNALLDCGFLHDVKHQNPFDCSDTEFMLDEILISNTQPLIDQTTYEGSYKQQNLTYAISNGARKTSMTSNVGTNTICSALSSLDGSQLKSCKCRRLAQGLEMGKVSKKYTREKPKRSQKKSVSAAHSNFDSGTLTANLLSSAGKDYKQLNEFDEFDAVVIMEEGDASPVGTPGSQSEYQAASDTKSAGALNLFNLMTKDKK